MEKWIALPDRVTVPVHPLSDLITSIGTPEFDVRLLGALQNVAPVAEVAGYVQIGTAAPMAAGWAGVRADAGTRVQSYVAQSHRRDPVLNSLPKETQTLKGYARILRARDVRDEDYRWTYFDAPDFRMELAVATKTRLGWNLIKCSFQDARLPETALRETREMVFFLFAIAQRHATRSELSISPKSRPMASERLLTNVMTRFPELTEREAQVCAHALLGASTQEIAEKLAISENSVKTYRRRAYGRLGIKRAGELLFELI